MFKRRPIFLFSITAISALTILSACSTPKIEQLDSASQTVFNPAHNDSMRTECTGPLRAYADQSAPPSLASLKQMAQSTLAQQGLNVRWEVQSPHAQGLAFDDQIQDRQRLARLLDASLPALMRYPKKFFADQQVREIVLVKDFQVGGQFRLAMPAPESDSLVYADNGHPQLCMAGMEMRVHHEFYHLIEYRMHQDFYFRDPAWLSLNPSQIQYGQGGATAYGKQFQNLGHPQAGLVSVYAGYGSEEDKAEVFGWMMTPGYAERLQDWVKQDSALAKKLGWMQNLRTPQLAESAMSH